MLKKDVSLFNDVFDLFDKNWAILTAGGKDFNSMTVSWGQIGILWGKKIATVYVRPTRYTYEFIEKYDNFTLSFLDFNKYKEALTFFGRKSGRDYDKFKETGLNPVYDVDFDATYIKEAKYVLKMKKIYVSKIDKAGFIDEGINKHYDNDYHYVYVGEIKQFLVEE